MENETVKKRLEEMAVSDKVSQLKSAKNIGRREGRRENAIENVKRLFRNGASFELVQKSVLELPEEEIRKIYEEICLTEDEK